jgi:hypothetical protein
MTEDDVKKAIKQRGYWEVVFTPRVFDAALIPNRSTCKQMLQDNVVRLRGWNYPHITKSDMDHQKAYLGSDYCGAFIDWGAYKEVLRFYQSAQFVHYFAVHEDWDREDKLNDFVGSSDGKRIKPNSALSFLGAIYTLTEVYEFLRRLAMNTNIYNSGVRVEIKLHNTLGRKLVNLDPSRLGLFDDYVSNTSPIILPAKELAKDDVISSSNKIALEAVKYLFETFQWENMPTEVFERDQQNFLERRF